MDDGTECRSRILYVNSKRFTKQQKVLLYAHTAVNPRNIVPLFLLFYYLVTNPLHQSCLPYTANAAYNSSPTVFIKLRTHFHNDFIAANQSDMTINSRDRREASWDLGWIWYNCFLYLYDSIVTILNETKALLCNIKILLCNILNPWQPPVNEYVFKCHPTFESFFQFVQISIQDSIHIGSIRKTVQMCFVKTINKTLPLMFRK